MLKKRLIFVLYFSNGKFHLSRNFKLQSVGDARWLFDKFKFHTISKYVDEIIILDVDRDRRRVKYGFSIEFIDAVKFLMQKTFCPLTIGGGITSLEQVANCFDIGADKVLFNTAAISCPQVIRESVLKFGSQAVLGGVDFKADHSTWINNGTELAGSIQGHVEALVNLGVGEVLLNNIDADGTGQGFNLEILSYLPPGLSVPLIICGGAGKPLHFRDALLRQDVDAVATGNLFNFIGNGFEVARKILIDSKLSVRSL